MTNPTPEVELIARLRDDDTDPVMLRQAADLITTLIEERAGQSHDAGLLAALEAVRRQIAQQRGGALYPNDADGFEMALDDIDEAARAAIAAAKGAGK